MTTLLMMFCLASSPDECITVPRDAPNMFECSGISGQASVVLWLQDHPNYVFKGWRCSYGRPA